MQDVVLGGFHALSKRLMEAGARIWQDGKVSVAWQPDHSHAPLRLQRLRRRLGDPDLFTVPLTPVTRYALVRDGYRQWPTGRMGWPRSNPELGWPSIIQSAAFVFTDMIHMMYVVVGVGAARDNGTSTALLRLRFRVKIKSPTPKHM